VALFPTMSNRAWTAVERSSRCRRSAVGTMLCVFARGWNLLAVFSAVAGFTKSNTVRHIKHQFGKLCNGLNVVGVNIPARFAAFLTGVIISLINSSTPFCKIALCLGTGAKQGFTALPVSSFLPRHAFSAAGARAENRAFIAVVENLSAKLTSTRLGWVAMRPAIFRAVMRGIGAVRLHFEWRSAYLTGLRGLSVLHRTIIPHSILFTTAYIAERWSIMTGKQPVLQDI
jgi:hypothetical protein